MNVSAPVPDILLPLLWLLHPDGWPLLMGVWAIALVVYALLDTAVEKAPEFVVYFWAMVLVLWNLLLFFGPLADGLALALAFCFAVCLVVGAPLAVAAVAIWWRNGYDCPCYLRNPAFAAVLLELALLPLGGGLVLLGFVFGVAVHLLA